MPTATCWVAPTRNVSDAFDPRFLMRAQRPDEPLSRPGRISLRHVYVGGSTLVTVTRRRIDNEWPRANGTERRRVPRAARCSRPVAWLAVVAACATMLAACGGSGGSGGSGSSKSGGAVSASASSATVTVKNVSGYGSALTTSSGQPLYLLTADPSGGSKCTGACASQWRPLVATGTLKAGPGASASLLSKFKRGDGSEQVLYNGHALYTHAGSAASAAGTASDGGIWYLVGPSGDAIKSTTGGGY